MRLTAAIASALVLLLPLVLSACSDDDDTASGAGIIPLSCSSLRELRQYNYRVGVELGPPPQDGNQGETLEARDALARAIDLDLLAFSVNGRVVPPDDDQATLGFPGGDIELRRVSDRTWTRIGETWTEEPSPDGKLLDAQTVCDFVSPLVASARTEGVPDSTFVLDSEAQHYHVSLEGGADLKPLLGDVASGRYTIDLWLSKNGRWPATIVIQSNNGESNAERRYRLAAEVYDANDVSLHVDKPS